MHPSVYRGAKSLMSIHSSVTGKQGGGDPSGNGEWLIYYDALGVWIEYSILTIVY